MTAKTMAADDEDNEVDGDGATGNGAMGDYGDDDDAKNGGDADEARSAAAAAATDAGAVAVLADRLSA
jgi:hypothetical protein